MVYCSNCGKKNLETDKFCTDCGEILPHKQKGANFVEALSDSDVKNENKLEKSQGNEYNDKMSYFINSGLNMILFTSWLSILGLTIYIYFFMQETSYMVARVLETGVAISISYGLYLITFKLLAKKQQYLISFVLISVFVSYCLMFFLFYTYYSVFFLIVILLMGGLAIGRLKYNSLKSINLTHLKLKRFQKITRFFVFGFIFSTILVINFDFLIRVVWTPPKSSFGDPDLLMNEAKGISDNLNDYIYEWYKGNQPSEIPDALIPQGVDFSFSNNFRLIKYEEIANYPQWLHRNATGIIDFNRLQGGLPEPHVTYLVLATPLAPFGSKVIIEGEFPYCRFFSIQVSAPFDGKSFTLNKVFGPAEVSIVDADITPLPGHQNPFLPGANRLVTNRSYQQIINLAVGDPIELNPDFKPPYRTTNSTITGSFILNQGPYWDDPIFGKGIGKWNTGLLWIRYYAPDLNKDPWGGVPLPKVYFQLPTGEKYFIVSNSSGWEYDSNRQIKAIPTEPTDPSEVMGPTKGWGKSYGIFRNIPLGIFDAWNKLSQTNIDFINEIDLQMTGRGENQKAPHNYEPHATTNNYAAYLGRGMNLGENKVIVLTGKMPTYPKTLNGSEIFTTGEVRYWSLGTYDVNNILSPTITCCFSGIMDEEVIIDDTGHYILVYTRADERPSNAYTTNNVNWLDWGPASSLGFIMRWISVMPEWSAPFNPHEENLPWEICDMGGSQYNSSLIGTNDQKGFMGEYLPKVHYMSVSEFEALGTNFTYQDIPDWI